MTRPELEHRTERVLAALHSELDSTCAPELIDDVSRRHFEALWARARIPDYVPLFVYRYTREDVTSARDFVPAQ